MVTASHQLNTLGRDSQRNRVQIENQQVGLHEVGKIIELDNEYELENQQLGCREHERENQDLGRESMKLENQELDREHEPRANVPFDGMKECDLTLLASFAFACNAPPCIASVRLTATA